MINEEKMYNDISSLFQIPEIDPRLEGNHRRIGVKFINNYCYESSIVFNEKTYTSQFAHPWLAHKWYQVKLANGMFEY